MIKLLLNSSYVMFGGISAGALSFSICEIINKKKYNFINNRIYFLPSFYLGFLIGAGAAFMHIITDKPVINYILNF